MVGTAQSAFAHPTQFLRRPPTLNKTSIKPAVYGERFVKRRGLFSVALASGHDVVSGCVAGRAMIVRQFISWIRTAPAGERAEATRALARAWLISDLTEDDRAAAEGALLMMHLRWCARPWPFARSAEAPAAIVQALSLDQPSIALPILEHSPLLIDADLVDIVATGNCELQCAIARRINLPASVCAAIAEVGTPAAALELVENAHADLAPFSWDRIAERHGHLAAIRESMLVLDDLPAAMRATLAAKVCDRVGAGGSPHVLQRADR